MKRKRSIIVLLLFVALIMVNPIRAKADDKFLSINKKTNISMKVGETVTVKVKAKFRLSGWTVVWDNQKPSIAECWWSGGWKNNTLKLKIKAKKPGTSKITIGNYYDDQKIVIKVTVKKLWDGVKVSCPYTIGGEYYPGNRMEMTKYKFYKDDYSNSSYDMYVYLTCVQKKEESTYWSCPVYFYNKNHRVIGSDTISASDYSVGDKFLCKIYSIPKNTKYIRFMEYYE